MSDMADFLQPTDRMDKMQHEYLVVVLILGRCQVLCRRRMATPNSIFLFKSGRCFLKSYELLQHGNADSLL